MEKPKKEDSQSHVRTLAVLHESQTFGEHSLIDGQQRSGYAECFDAGIIIVLTKAKLMAMLEKVPRLAYKITWKIAESLSSRLRLTGFKYLDR